MGGAAKTATSLLDEEPLGLKPEALKLLAWSICCLVRKWHTEYGEPHGALEPATILLAADGSPHSLSHARYHAHHVSGPNFASSDDASASALRAFPSHSLGPNSSSPDAHGNRTYACGLFEEDYDTGVSGSGSGSSTDAANGWCLAPEQLLGKHWEGTVGTAVDVFSIGCLVAELATGQPLFPGASPAEQLRRMTRLLGPLAFVGTAKPAAAAPSSPSIATAMGPHEAQTDAAFDDNTDDGGGGGGALEDARRRRVLRQWLRMRLTSVGGVVGETLVRKGCRAVTVEDTTAKKTATEVSVVELPDGNTAAEVEEEEAEQLLGLLESCLQVDPSRRPSMEELMRLPYFAAVAVRQGREEEGDVGTLVGGGDDGGKDGAVDALAAAKAAAAAAAVGDVTPVGDEDDRNGATSANAALQCPLTPCPSLKTSEASLCTAAAAAAVAAADGGTTGSLDSGSGGSTPPADTSAGTSESPHQQQQPLNVHPQLPPPQQPQQQCQQSAASDSFTSPRVAGGSGRKSTRREPSRLRLTVTWAGAEEEKEREQEEEVERGVERRPLEDGRAGTAVGARTRNWGAPEAWSGAEEVKEVKGGEGVQAIEPSPWGRAAAAAAMAEEEAKPCVHGIVLPPGCAVDRSSCEGSISFDVGPILGPRASASSAAAAALPTAAGLSLRRQLTSPPTCLSAAPPSPTPPAQSQSYPRSIRRISSPPRSVSLQGTSWQSEQLQAQQDACSCADGAEVGVADRDRVSSTPPMQPTQPQSRSGTRPPRRVISESLLAPPAGVTPALRAAIPEDRVVSDSGGVGAGGAGGAGALAQRGVTSLTATRPARERSWPACREDPPGDNFLQQRGRSAGDSSRHLQARDSSKGVTDGGEGGRAAGGGLDPAAAHVAGRRSVSLSPQRLQQQQQQCPWGSGGRQSQRSRYSCGGDVGGSSTASSFPECPEGIDLGEDARGSEGGRCLQCSGSAGGPDRVPQAAGSPRSALPRLLNALQRELISKLQATHAPPSRAPSHPSTVASAAGCGPLSGTVAAAAAACGLDSSKRKSSGGSRALPLPMLQQQQQQLQPHQEQQQQGPRNRQEQQQQQQQLTVLPDVQCEDHDCGWGSVLVSSPRGSGLRAGTGPVVKAPSPPSAAAEKLNVEQPGSPRSDQQAVRAHILPVVDPVSNWSREADPDAFTGMGPSSGAGGGGGDKQARQQQHPRGVSQPLPLLSQQLHPRRRSTLETGAWVRSRKSPQEPDMQRDACLVTHSEVPFKHLKTLSRHRPSPLLLAHADADGGGSGEPDVAVSAPVGSPGAIWRLAAATAAAAAATAGARNPPWSRGKSRERLRRY
ncbi:hypothetical protein Agub_g13920, partial [Astrephomene gubernaculifera]